MEQALKDLVSIRDAGRIAGVSHVTIWRWVKDGKLEGVRITNRIFVRRSEVEAYSAKRSSGVKK